MYTISLAESTGRRTMTLKPMLEKLMVAAIVSIALLASTPADAFTHATEVEAWRTGRLDRLQAPGGWLSLVGLHWVEPGEHSVGAAPDNDIVLATGPARLGWIRLAGGELHFIPDLDEAAWINEQRITGEVLLNDGTRPRISFAAGAASLEPLERGGRFALRVRDANSPIRTGFTGIDAYPVDASWSFKARFETHPPGRSIEIANVLGQTDAMANPGVLVFEHEGREFRLETVDEDGEQLFVIFADRTNRNETYGAGRFVYVDRPVDGTTTIDFNRAYNPPCAFTAYSTCPLPPPENRLDIAVTAGEQRYRGPTS
jgi:uncharacterized protein